MALALTYKGDHPLAVQVDELTRCQFLSQEPELRLYLLIHSASTKHGAGRLEDLSHIRLPVPKV